MSDTTPDSPDRRAQNAPPVGDPAKVAIAKEARKAQRTRQFDLDTRGLLAILALVGAFGLSFAELFITHPHTAEIPQWAASGVAAILGFYFGSKIVSGGDGSGKNGD